jgi:hypothetical protein
VTNNEGVVEAQNGGSEGLKADSHHLDEEQVRIRINIEVKSWFRIRIKVKIWIRIRIQVMRIQNPEI